MKYRINFNGDSFIIEADTIEEIREKSFKELERRGIDLLKTSCWSEEIK